MASVRSHLCSMLPNAAHAVVDLAKLRDYALSPVHPGGRHKARVFARVLGIGPDDAEWLQSRILGAIPDAVAVHTGDITHGALYQADLTLVSDRGSAAVRTC